MDIFIRSFPTPPIFIRSTASKMLFLRSPTVATETIFRQEGRQGAAGPPGFAFNNIAPTELTGNKNNYSIGITTAATKARISSAGSVNITGISGGIDGYLLMLVNVGTENITLTGNDGASLAANQFNALYDPFALLSPGGTVTMIYDTNIWREF